MKFFGAMVKWAALMLCCTLAIGCAGRQVNADLANARQVFDEAQADADVIKHAPVALKEAEEALDEAEELWQMSEEPKRISRKAYIAELKTRIAKEKAATRIAERQIEKAEVERQRVLILARTEEAESRAREADTARLEAQQRAREADEALKRAEELSRQVQELEAKQTERGLVLTLGDVLFDFNKANLKPGGLRVVGKLAQFMAEFPTRKVQIEGFTDSIGSEEYNQQLSEQRAEFVRDALRDQGIDRNRLFTVGYGERFPVATNASNDGRQRNRRVEIVISDEQGNIPEK